MLKVTSRTLSGQDGVVVERYAAHPAEYAGAAESSPELYRIAKRVLDIVASLTVLILLSPLLLVIALLIVATSRGPALYRARRVGERGRLFTMYKFRSMYQNADPSLHRQAYARYIHGKGGNGKVDHETLAELAELAGAGAQLPECYTHRPFMRAWYRISVKLSGGDPRVTPVGAVLRKLSLDELPQFVNVLIGDMSLVGPRPPIPYEVRLYSPHHLRRLAVTPGITGIWQVYGRGRVPFEHMVDMDLQYIATRSFWLDLRLLLLTVPSVLFARGAK
jgi:lipopolysaccharide/colanic/teichoic acid biosynthesis glycosyltransferase